MIQSKTPQLIKYIGNKTRYASEIISSFPNDYDLYVEPFFGSGAILGHLRPKKAIAVDAHKPLIDMWKLVRDEPISLANFYEEKWTEYSSSIEAKSRTYKQVVDSYNSKPNPLDFLFISRTCYGGVLRYRKVDGFLSTPLGSHKAISPRSFSDRLKLWHEIVQNVDFLCGDFSEIEGMITARTLMYCDPPYVDSQKILYGAQDFDISKLYTFIARVKEVGASVALSIDGSKKSGQKIIELSCSDAVFEEELMIKLGGSMLKRFQLNERDTRDHQVQDRLLLTYKADTSLSQLGFGF